MSSRWGLGAIDPCPNVVGGYHNKSRHQGLQFTATSPFRQYGERTCWPQTLQLSQELLSQEVWQPAFGCLRARGLDWSLSELGLNCHNKDVCSIIGFLNYDNLDQVLDSTSKRGRQRGGQGPCRHPGAGVRRAQPAPFASRPRR